MAFADIESPTPDDVRTEIRRLRGIRSELLEVPVSGSVGGTSMSFAGRRAELTEEIEELEGLLAEMLDAGSTRRPQILK